VAGHHRAAIFGMSAFRLHSTSHPLEGNVRIDNICIYIYMYTYIYIYIYRYIYVHIDR
jgi:hypothetical protein